MRIAILGGVLGAVSVSGCSGSGESEEARRFMEDAAQCRPGEFVARENVGAGRYAVDGPAEDGNCRVTFAYVEHPNPGCVGQELSFVVDTGEPVREQVRAGVAECLEGRNGPHQCEGELFRAVGGVEAVTDGPMLCGQPVEEQFSEPLYPLPKDGAWGVIDRRESGAVADSDQGP